MSEFELSTLMMVLVLLACLGGYSYWQIYRVKRMQHEPIMPEMPESDASDDTHASKAGILTKARLPKRVRLTPHWIGPVKEVVDEDQTRAMTLTTDVVSAASMSEIMAAESISDDTNDSHVLRTVHGEERPELAVIIHSPEQRSAVVGLHPSVNEVKAQAVLTEETHHVFPESTAVVDDILALAEERSLSVDPQFFNAQDLSEQATLQVFEPLIRFSAWVESTHPAPIHSIDGVIDLTVSQPKNAQDIERALHDLRLDTDLPLRLLGVRSGQISATYSDNPSAARVLQPLEAGALYSGLRLTLQLANAKAYASPQLIQDWFELGQRFAKRLAAHVHAWPDPAALGSYALYLHDLSHRLGAPLVVQLRKPQGLWAAYEVHQQMTQWGLQLNDHGQYVARHEDGCVLYRVLNDLNNPRAQDFYRDGLATMHVHTLSFCLDLARVGAHYTAEQRMWHDMAQLGNALHAHWCNAAGQTIVADQLFAHAAEHIPAYLQQLNALAVPAGTLSMKRLLQGQ